MDFVWDSGNTGNLVLNIIFIALTFIVCGFAVIKLSKRKTALVFVLVFTALSVFAFIFNLIWLYILSICLYTVGCFMILYSNIGDLRKFLAAPFSKKTAKNGKFGLEKIYDSKALYNEVKQAIINLSNTRTGAIMTFEKSTTLKDISKNGVPINAPVTHELLETIFYPGTRLHDGAVIIHGNEITYASVFFTPSTKPFAGKYGSRHRAAIGISEVSDAITVIVSEETGRVSIAVNGELETVDPDNFIRAFENYMKFEAE